MLKDEMVLLMKCMPWFETIVRGHPNLVKMHSYKNLAITTIVLESNALASIHLVV
jgi:hypothetical protein